MRLLVFIAAAVSIAASASGLAAQTRLACPAPNEAPLWHLALCELSQGIEEREDRYIPSRAPSIWHAIQFKNMTFMDWKTETLDVLAGFDEMLTSTGTPAQN